MATERSPVTHRSERYDFIGDDPDGTVQVRTGYGACRGFA